MKLPFLTNALKTAARLNRKGTDWLDRAAQVWRFAARRTSEEALFQVAASLTFTTVLALVPTLAVVLSLFTAFPIFQEFRVALEDFLGRSLMPPALSGNIMNYINQFAYQAHRLTAIGGGFLFIMSLLLIMTIDKTFNDIWHVTKQRPALQRILVYWATVTLGPVLVGASLWATSLVIRQSLGLMGGMTEVFRLILSFLPVLLTGLGFSALFVLIPNRYVCWKDAIAGGFVTAIALECMKSGFAYYVTRFPTYTLIYGTFATLPIFFLWIYLSWLSVLFGATVAASLPAIRVGRWEINQEPGAAFIDALESLQCLYSAMGATPAGYSTSELAMKLHIHHDELNALLEELVELGFVAQTQDQHWLLACDPHRTYLTPLFDRFLLKRGQKRLHNKPKILQTVYALLGEKPELTLEDFAQSAAIIPNVSGAMHTLNQP